MRETHLTHHASLHEMCTIKQKSFQYVYSSIYLQAARTYFKKKEEKKGVFAQQFSFLGNKSNWDPCTSHYDLRPHQKYKSSFPVKSEYVMH